MIRRFLQEASDVFCFLLYRIKVSVDFGTRIHYQQRRRNMVKVNGELLDLAGKTISEYLTTTEYDPKRIAVERNGEIVLNRNMMMWFCRMKTA